MIGAVLCMIVAMVSIAGGASLAKSIFPVVGPEMATTLRLGIAALILCAVFRPWRQWPQRHQIKHLLFYGAALGLMNLFFYLSITRIPLGIAVALEFTGPLAVALYTTRHWRDVIWVAFAVVGIAALLPVTQLSAPLDITGVILALCAGVFWALYIVAGKRAAERMHEPTNHSGIIVAWGMVVAAIVAAPMGLIASDGSGLMEGSVWFIALGVALLSSAIPYSLEMTALKKLPTQTFGILTSMEPAISAVSGYLFLAEHLSLVQMLAIGAIIAASIGCMLSTNRRQPAVPPLAN